MRLICRAATVLAVFALPVLAEPNAADPPDPFLILSGGVDRDEDGGTLLAAGIAYLPDDALFLSADLGRADTQTDLSDLESDFAAVALDYSAGPVGFGLSGGWNSSEDTVERYQYGGSVHLTSGGFKLELSGEQWLSDLDSVRFDDLPAPFDRVALACDIDNTVLGLGGSYSGQTFGLYGRWRDYRYADADCDLSLPNGTIISLNGIDPAVLTDETRQRLRRLGEIQRRSGRLQQQVADAAFLDQSIAAGVYWQPADVTYQVDYFRSEEAFGELEIDSFTGSVTFPAGNTLDLELRAGISTGNGIDDVTFIGATLYWYLPL